MKANSKLLTALNERLSEEISAVSQYMIHAEILANWGYPKLHEAIEKQAHDEMHQAEALIDRILFLDGLPDVKQALLNLGKDVPSIIELGLEDELDAVKKYNETIRFASELGDNGTRELSDQILVDEERYLDWGETQQSLMQQLGLSTYLNAQV
jgi:bacterioferritin